MALLAVVALALVSVPIFKGRLSALGDVTMRWGWTIAVAIGLQILIISIIPDRFTSLHVPIHLLSYGFAGVFIAANIREPGIAIIGAGTLLNVIAIVANGGVMPADPAAMRAAGIVQKSGHFANSTDVADPNLLFLGDIFVIPKSVPYLDTVFSIGDVLIAIGAFVLIHTICGSKLALGRPRLAEHPSA